MPDLHRIVGFVPWQDGRGAAIRASTADGTIVDVDVPFTELGDIVAGLIQACIASKRGPLAAPRTGSPVDIPTVEARGIGIAAMGQNGRTGFVVDLQACLIGFSVPNDAMANLGAELAQICSAMSADEEKRQ